MKKLNGHELTTVVGGTTRVNDQITQQLTTLSTSIKDIASNNNNNSSNNLLLPMAMMMAFRPQPTVVAGAPAYAAPSSVINISTRFRRW